MLFSLFIPQVWSIEIVTFSFVLAACNSHTNQQLQQTHHVTMLSFSGETTTEIRYVHILNKVLPPEVRILAWAPVEESFSAR